jgi:hypothetical protein
LQEFSAHHLSQRFVRQMRQATTSRQTPHRLAINTLRQFRTAQLQASVDVGVKVSRS